MRLPGSPGHFSPPRRYIRPAGLAGLSLAVWLSMGAAQAEQLIKFSAAQIQNAGIRTAAVIAPAAAAGAQGNPAAANGLHLSGTVTAPADAAYLLSSSVGGVVQHVQVNSLQSVNRDSVIATLFSQQLIEMQRDYVQLATQARLSQDKLERDEKLFSEGIIAQSRLQDSRAAATQAGIAARERYQSLRSAGMSEPQLRQLMSTLQLSGMLNISAQRAGTVSEVQIRPGQRLEAGAPIALITDDRKLWIEFPASGQQAAQIRTGDLMLLEQCAPARVIAIANHMQNGSQTRLIRALATDKTPCLKLNQFVEARHQSATPASEGLGVPSQALIRKNNQAEYVMVKQAQGFSAVKVKVLSRQGDQVWVQPLDGALTAGNQVATQGLIALKGAWSGLGGAESGEQ